MVSETRHFLSKHIIAVADDVAATYTLLQDDTALPPHAVLLTVTIYTYT